jgi:hypothetical protein
MKTLASVMDCGLAWLISVFPPNQRRQPVKLKTWLLTAAFQKFLQFEKGMLNDSQADESIWSTTEGRDEASTLINLAMRLIRNGLPLFSETSMDTWQPVCLSNDIGSKALMFARRPAGSEIVCASPLILFRDEYSWLYRGWTLQKGSPEVVRDSEGLPVWKYHLMGKSRVFGMISAVNEGESFANKVKGVRFYGPLDDDKAQSNLNVA